MSPTAFFILLVMVTVLSWLARRLAQDRNVAELIDLARQWNMHYSKGDRFRLADRVAQLLPIAGAADVRVEHLIYGNDAQGYRYVMTADFTEGVVRSKRRVRRVVALKERRYTGRASGWSELLVAPHELPLVEQYKHLHELQAEEPRTAADSLAQAG